MEIEFNPEHEPVGVECDYCGGTVELTDETCGLQVYIDPDYSKYSFAIVACPEEDCDPMYLFVSPEQIAQLGHITNHFIEARPSDKALPFLEEQWNNIYGQVIEVESREVEEWGKVMLRFLEVYQPEAWEFSGRLYR